MIPCDEQAKRAYRAGLLAAYGRWERSDGTPHAPEAWFTILFEATAQEAHTVEEMVALSAFAFVERITACTPEAAEALQGPMACEVLRYARETLSEEALATPESANAYFRTLRHHFRDVAGLRGQQVMFPIRAALTGTMVGPCLGVVASLLGAARAAQRLEEALRALEHQAEPPCICLTGRALEARP